MRYVVCPYCRRKTEQWDVFGYCEHCGRNATAGSSPTYVEELGAVQTVEGPLARIRGGPKQRHGCVTAYLVFVIVVNGLVALVTPLLSEQIREQLPRYQPWVVWVTALVSLLNVGFAVALLNWKRWGFYGFCLSALVALGLNLYVGVGIAQSLLGLVGVGILYAVLQVGTPQKAWDQLD